MDHSPIRNKRRSRRAFLQNAVAAAAAGGAATVMPLDAAPTARCAEPARPPAKRVFVAAFSHETNTFHPVKTTKFNCSELKFGEGPYLPIWKDTGLVAVPGVAAHPAGGGTIDGPACRQAMNRVLDSLRASMPVDAVFLRLHGAIIP